MTRPEELEALWDRYDGAMVAYHAYTAITMDPDTLEGCREEMDRALNALRAVGHEPVPAEDEAVRTAAADAGPGWRERVRTLRPHRHVTPGIRVSGTVSWASEDGRTSHTEMCPTCGRTHGLFLTRSAALRCPDCNVFFAARHIEPAYAQAMVDRVLAAPDRAVGTVTSRRGTRPYDAPVVLTD